MNKYDNYGKPELEQLVAKMEDELKDLQKEFAKFQESERAEVVKLELEKSKTPASDPEYNARNEAWLNRRQQSELAIQQMQQKLQGLEQEYRYAKEALDRKIAAEEEAQKQ